MKTNYTTYFNAKKEQAGFLKGACMFIFFMISFTGLQAQSIAGSTWDLATSTGSSGYTNWGSGVISLTDTTTGSGTCQGSAVTETSGINPASNFSQCFRVFFGCPTNDQIGTLASPYTDFNGDGMAFSFWKNNATFTATNANTCGGGLGYDNALTGGASDGKMITIEFDTYSSLGTSTVDGSYGGGAPGSGINDEISVHKDMNSNDGGLINPAGTVNAGNLEDGFQHDLCISYNAGTHILTVTLDAVTKLSYDLGATYNLSTYFGASTLNYTWSAGKYGANNLQTVGPSGTNLFAVMGHNPCTGAVVMPVSLIAFTAEMMNETVVLNWTTVVETNNKKFIIERSQNLSNWVAIGEVAGNGNTTALVNYSFTDNAPLNGLTYYRLKQVDNNGTYSNSNVVVIEQTKGQLVNIGPNPFDEALTITTNIKGSLDISIHDVLGRLLYQAKQKVEDGKLLLHPELASGAYVITIQTDAFVEQQRIIKK